MDLLIFGVILIIIGIIIIVTCKDDYSLFGVLRCLAFLGAIIMIITGTLFILSECIMIIKV